MPKSRQNESGRAWEYGLARQFSDRLNAPLQRNAPSSRAQRSYEGIATTEQQNINNAAEATVCFLQLHDARIMGATHISMQNDMQGTTGEVRDLIIHSRDGTDIGISAKHRHHALKHSRLSREIDFGKKWYGKPCSADYWATVRPQFDDLAKQQARGDPWRDIPDKDTRYYYPILTAFMREVREHAATHIKPMMQYLLGEYDHYKINKENGHVSILSLNMKNTLKFGRRVKRPTTLINIRYKPNSRNTVHLYLNEGWSVSFRLHNARSQVEPSLKFDIQLIGCPMTLYRHYLIP